MVDFLCAIIETLLALTVQTLLVVLDLRVGHTMCVFSPLITFTLSSLPLFLSEYTYDDDDAEAMKARKSRLWN